MAAVVCLLLGQSSCNSLFLLSSFALCPSRRSRIVQGTLVIIPGAYLALCTLWVFSRCYLVNPHTGPWRVEEVHGQCQAAPLGRASAGEFGERRGAVAAQGKGLCLLLQQHCRRVRGEGRALTRSAWLQGR